MKTRPTSVSVIAWILIVTAGLGLLSTASIVNNEMVREMMEQSPIPLNVQFVMSFAGLGAMILSGIFMLKGQNWARFLYVGWTGISFVINFITLPTRISMIPSLIFFIVVCIFLFTKKSNAYFTGKLTPEDAVTEDSPDVP